MSTIVHMDLDAFFVSVACLENSALRGKPVIIGGFGNMEGTIIAGILVGIIEAFTVQYLGSGVIDLVVFVLLLFFLFSFPIAILTRSLERRVRAR